MFTTSELQKAKRIADHMTKSADFGNVAGNVGESALGKAFPRYNIPPMFSSQVKPKNFMQSVGAMAKGTGNWLGHTTAGALTGEKGEPGMLDNTLRAGLQAVAHPINTAMHPVNYLERVGRGVRDPWNRSQWNFKQDPRGLQNLTAPGAWAGQKKYDVLDAPGPLDLDNHT